jgi:hypothetical protein
VNVTSFSKVFVAAWSAFLLLLGVAQAVPAVAVPPDGPLITETVLWGSHGTAVLRTVARDGEPGDYFAAAGSTIDARAYVAPEGVNDITVQYWWELRCYDAASKLVKVPTAPVTATLKGDPKRGTDPTYLAPPTLTPQVELTIPATCVGNRTNDTSVIFRVSYDGRTGARTAFVTLMAPAELPGPTQPSPASTATVTLWRVVQPAELADILAHGNTYRVPYPGYGKYFFTNRADAAALAQKFTDQNIGGPYTLTSATIREGELATAEAVFAAGESPAWYLPEELVESVGQVRIW